MLSTSGSRGAGTLPDAVVGLERRGVLTWLAASTCREIKESRRGTLAPSARAACPLEELERAQGGDRQAVAGHVQIKIKKKTRENPLWNLRSLGPITRRRPSKRPGSSDMYVYERTVLKVLGAARL